MKHKNIIERNGRTFELVTAMEAGFHGERARVYIYEVIRPNARFFRTRWLDSKGFWISDFPTIMDGIYCMLDRLLVEEYAERQTQKKWEEFEKN